ncbi:hypothetical protein [Brevibacillus sp. AY1]|uniref:hypothetical protein n=1 Tax=Brevibacillus sp. AY1 TaxID=2807621 RepID=UPI0024576741|nr:hypothetical protein [Brevibacillus sp. AY1]MDH4619958.1 hypothetical protein [Brevibacillus sp. AY1]
MKKISLVVISSVLLFGIGTYAWMNQWKQEKIGSHTYRTNLFTNETERFDSNLGWISMEQTQKQDAELQAVLAQQTIQQKQYYQQQAATPVSAN